MRVGGEGGRGGSEGGREPELRSLPPAPLTASLGYFLKLYNVFNDNSQYEKGGGLLSGRASERKSEPK